MSKVSEDIVKMCRLIAVWPDISDKTLIEFSEQHLRNKLNKDMLKSIRRVTGTTSKKFINVGRTVVEHAALTKIVNSGYDNVTIEELVRVSIDACDVLVGGFYSEVLIQDWVERLYLDLQVVKNKPHEIRLMLIDRAAELREKLS